MEEEEIRLNGYLAGIWRAKWLIILIVILASLTAAFLTSRQAVIYKASALIKVGRVWKEPLEDPYLTTETVNSNGFLHDLAVKAGVDQGRLKRAIQAETMTGGPQRATYPILVRIIGTTESGEESAKLVTTVADEVLAVHQRLFDQAIASHRDYQQRLESLLAAQPRSIEESVKLQHDLDEIRSENSSPTVTEKTTVVGSIVPGGVIKPDVVEKTVETAAISFIVAILIAVIAGYFSGSGSRLPSQGTHSQD